MAFEYTLSVMVLFTIEMLCTGGNAETGGNTNLLQIGTIDQCEGKDALNYTFIGQWSENAAGEKSSIQHISSDTLTARLPNGQLVVNQLQNLAESLYPAGAYNQWDEIYLVTSGNLEGKYVLLQETDLDEKYLKKSSSVLGLSYVTSKSLVLLIADRLDPNVLISPTGPLEQFKKSSTTICSGRSNTF